MSWFTFNWTQKDKELLLEWRRNVGFNVKFFDEVTNSFYEPNPEDEFLPVPVYIDEDYIDVREIPVKSNKRMYKPRKQIPKKVKNHLIALRGFACENCQENGYDHIHHLDCNPANNQIENLRLLCKQCHKKIHAREIRK